MRLNMKWLLAGFGVALLLVSGAVVSAQAIDTCFGLSAEDCAVINAASANTDLLTSFDMTFSIDFSVTGLPDGDLTFSLDGEGSVVENDGSSLIPVDTETTMTVSFTAPDLSATDVTVQSLTVDGVSYSQASDNPWVMIDLNEAMTGEAASAFMGDLPFDPMTMGADIPPNMAAALVELAAVDGFLDYERVDDTFVFTADFATLFQSNAFIEAGDAMMAVDPSMGALALLPSIVETGTVQVTQHLDPDANVIDLLEFRVDAVVDANMIDATLEDPVGVGLVFVVEIDNLDGATIDMTPPDDAINALEMNGE